MKGSIKLYRIAGNASHDLKLETAMYYTELERKRILIHWKRKYNGQMNNCYIQIAPGVDLTKTNKHEILNH